MLEALTYQDMINDIQRNSSQEGVWNDTIGILITRPSLPTGESILNNLEYFHFRTGKTMNFYLPGYGAYWTKEDYPDGEVVTTINGVNWSFSNKRFAEFLADLERYSTWNYSGESELLLVELKNGILCYEKTMQFYLDHMMRDGVIFSIPQFFEMLFRICKEGDSAMQISNKLKRNQAKHIGMEKILEKLPLSMGEIYKHEKYFRISNRGK